MPHLDPAQQCAQLIKESHAIAALTGAGISTNAGIPDFRGPHGLYVTKQYDPDTIFNIAYFYENPKPFYEFARDFIELHKTIQPTITHRFLAHLEDMGKLKGIITQNIDALHQQAGSKNVFEMHGSFLTSHCLECDKKLSFAEIKEKLSQETIPLCDCTGVIKPDVVFYGESVRCLEESAQLAHSADLFFVIGTSCVVYPAAMIPSLVTGKIIVVNQEKIEAAFSNIVLTVQEDSDIFFEKVKNLL